METIDDLLEKRQNKSLVAFMKLIDPERKFRIDLKLGDKWDALNLTDQRRLYLYLLYRKWRGEGFYGTPYDIISYCHPYPTNWDGRGQLLDSLLKEGKIVSAKFNGSYGLYTRDEARVWQMEDVQSRK